MTIKTLLISSAAGIMAVTGANAADAIIADAEPVDFVRVCDAYGSGFYFIPGTETCLSVGGFVRYDVNVASDTLSMSAVATVDAFRGAFNGLDRTNRDDVVSFVNANFDVLNGLGILPDDFNNGIAAGSIDANRQNALVGEITTATPAGIAAILGNTSALLAATGILTQGDSGWTKNARGVVNVDARSDTEFGTLRSFIALQGNSADGGAGNVNIDEAFLSLGGFYAGLRFDYFDGNGIGGENDSSAGNRVNAVGYDFSGEGFTAGIMLTDDADATGDARDFTPNVQGMVGVSFGPADMTVVAGYDNDAEEGLVEATAKFAVAEGVTFEALGLYASGSTAYWDTSEWTAAASINATLTDTVSASLGAQYFGDVGFVDGVDGYTIGANVDWTPVSNFLVRGRIQHTVIDFDNLGDVDSTTGYIRFQRSF